MKPPPSHDEVNETFAQELMSHALAIRLIQAIPPGWHSPPVLDAIKQYTQPGVEDA